MLDCQNVKSLQFESTQNEDYSVPRCRIDELESKASQNNHNLSSHFDSAFEKPQCGAVDLWSLPCSEKIA